MRELAALACLAVGMCAAPICAQDDPDARAGSEPQGSERVVIDILVPPPKAEKPTAADIKACEEERDAARLSREIIVCGELNRNTDQWFSGGREAWLRNYARRTQDAGTLPPPDVAGAGIFRGPPTISGLCFIPPCPKDPALLIDVEALPQAPDGSDAQRISKGLPPVGNEGEPAEDDPGRISEEELGLPPSRYADVPE